MQVIYLALVLFVTATAEGQQLRWLDFPRLEYPPMANIAGVQGEARIEVTLNAEGTIENISQVSGHPILLLAATYHLKQARLRCESCSEKTSFIVVYDFKRITTLPPGIHPCDVRASAPVLDSPTHITIYAKPVCVNVDPRGCPKLPARPIRCLYL